jgi:hypothetical protein
MHTSLITWFDGESRDAALSFGRKADGSRPAAVGRVHNDYSEASGQKRIELVLLDSSVRSQAQNFAIVNIWRSILVQYSPRHRWAYYSGMDSHEALVFKQYDSQVNGMRALRPTQPSISRISHPMRRSGRALRSAAW